jgi:glycosyltransferase involved in cell wall biosynthesis
MKKSAEQKHAQSIITSDENKKTKISVVVISYNQEKYIDECLNGIFKQKGDFTVELVIGDDCSTDRTLEIIKNYTENYASNDIKVKILVAKKNIGMTKNLQRCLYACTGEYIAVCEGDDYWSNCHKLQKQMEFLSLHPDCALCFHRIHLYFQESENFSVFEPDTKFVGNIFTTKDLILEYFIGNLSCCMYKANYVKQIDEDLFNLFIGDWMFNIYYSQFGDIGFLDEVMSVYRKHEDGTWAGMSNYKRINSIAHNINAYDHYLEYKYNREFSIYKKRLLSGVLWDIVIVDDVAPHPLSAFRYQEFQSYLKEFEGLKIYCLGLSIHLLGRETLEELISAFYKKYPQYAGQIETLKPDSLINAKLIYTVFLGNTFINIDEVEKQEIPFIFTLYPGGLFGLNNYKSDKMLRRVISSPCFRKVIVTQRITYDYLIEKQFCKPEQIEFIFGVVTPLEQLEKEYTGKTHFGIDKETLDICFVAHKYTETGTDKGYDVFTEVAIALSEQHSNIRFHVVGGFDEKVLDVSPLGDKIKFYGNREIEWFDDFYLDKDIILSPNLPFKIFEGSFDGFPTGSCTDAGLRETAIFCTDELKLNDGFFVDREEIVIVPHDVGEIVEIIEFYYSNPEKLAAIGKNGRRRIKELYSYEAQILPRINLLRTEVGLFEQNKIEIRKKFDSINFLQKHFSRLIKKLRRLSSRFFAMIRENTPPWLKSGIKRILPHFIIKFYVRFFA